MPVRDDKSVYEFSYMDWVLDVVSARLISIRSVVGDAQFPDYLDDSNIVNVQIQTPFRTYCLEVHAEVELTRVKQHWKVFVEANGPAEEIFTTTWNGFMVNIDPTEVTPLYTMEPYKRDFLITGAKAIGEKIGESIAQDLYNFYPSGIQNPKGRIAFNAFASSLAISRKHGEQFFLDLFDDVAEFVQDIQVVGPVAPPRERDFYLTFSISSAGSKYVLSCSCMVDDHDDQLYGESNWHLSKNYLWDEPTEWIGPGYYSTIHNYKGKRLRKELVIKIVDTIRYDQGLPRISESNSSPSGSQRIQTELKSQKSLWELAAETFDADEAFKVERSKRNLASISTPVSKDLLGAFALTPAMKQSANTIVLEYLETQWITWENQDSEIRKAKHQVKNWANSIWETQFPEYELITNKYTKSGQSGGQTFVAYSWFAVIAGVALLIFTGNAFVVAPAVVCLIAGKIYSKAIHKPAFYPTSLSNKKTEIVSEIGDYLGNQIDAQVKNRVEKAFGAGPEDWAAAVNHRWTPLGPRPILPDQGLTPAEAEKFTAMYLKFFGFSKVSTTRITKDGGIDVMSETLAVQVKHQANPVGVKVVREIYGVAKSTGRHAAVFTRNGYTKDAVEFAQSNDIALFAYEPKLVGHSRIALNILESGAPTLP